MSKRATQPASPADLRARAVSRLTGATPKQEHKGAPAAFGVLHELASSPSTAADALALLHELQVHQVELDLQAEELRGSCEELEAALHRQTQLYDCAPVGLLSVDAGGALHELNLTAAALLESERQALLGQPLQGFLAPDSARALQAMLTSVRDGRPGPVCTLHLLPRGGESQAVCATVNADPVGARFLVALMNAGANHDPAK